MGSILLFVLFGAMALGCAVAVVAQRNPLYSAISLVGVFISLACLYMTLAAPFIAAVQVIVYAGAIMVLVVFVIMLLNVEEEVRRPVRLHYMIGVGVLLGAALAAETFFMLTASGTGKVFPPATPPDVGLTASIGTGLFTEYLLPFEVTSVLILMALVGAITLARQARRGHLGGGDEELAAAEGPSEHGLIQPGLTAETGRAFARRQIEANEAAAPARGEEGARKEEHR
jgi:NADH-quinone oxidoreductase subunit J